MKKTAIITGAAGNLGQAVVKRLLSENYQVEAVIGLNDNPYFYKADNMMVHQLDLTEEMMAENFIRELSNQRESLDLAVLIVGGFATGGIKETNQQVLKKMYQLNFETAYFIARSLFAQMEKQETGGQIIFIGARPALDVKEGKDLMAYALSKSLIFKLSELMNEEGKGKNITTSVVVPSVIDTEFNRKSNPEANFDDWVKPETVAEVISFAASQTGKNLRQSIFKVYNNS